MLGCCWSCTHDQTMQGSPECQSCRCGHLGTAGRTWVEAGLPSARKHEVGTRVDAEDGVHGRPIQVGQSRVDCSIVLSQGVPLNAKYVRLCPKVKQDASAHGAVECGRLQGSTATSGNSMHTCAALITSCIARLSSVPYEPGSFQASTPTHLTRGIFHPLRGGIHPLMPYFACIHSLISYMMAGQGGARRSPL